jgi:hypothetical protein
VKPFYLSSETVIPFKFKLYRYVKYFTSTMDHTSITLINHAGTAAAYPDRPLPSTSVLPPGRLSSAQCTEAEVGAVTAVALSMCKQFCV